MNPKPPTMRAGVYIHIPFCRSRCSYCDFATGMYESSLAERYVQALTREISGFTNAADNQEIDTIYFGGGTPSLLSPAQVETILSAVGKRFKIASEAELTMEMNPGELTLDVLQEFRGLGINRASFGAQTFDDRELKHLGRTHTAADIRQTFHHLRQAGFDNISFDLIAGLPGQTLEAWTHNLDEALRLRPEHLSLYLLEVHEGTPLADQINRGGRPQPDDDLAAEMYRRLVQKVCAAGYQHYEISNFCLPGYESRHNTKYWTGVPYYGFGCSAHSYDGRARRWANERDAARYLELIERRQSPIMETVDLSEDDKRAESVFLGMRLLSGISLNDYRQRFGADLREDYASEIDRLNEAGLIELDNDLLRLTSTGALMSNEVFAALA
ncbi:MAG TPA: radical SAM family heme chaperone HemW [Pyrinomonadaceae bacterium]